MVKRYLNPFVYTVFYVLASGSAVVGIILVVKGNRTAADLGTLVAFAGIFASLSASKQELDKRHIERRQGREQEERESLRRFDERFAAVIAGIGRSSAPDDSDRLAGAAAELMTFLQEGLETLHEQTYFYTLAHLTVCKADPFTDRVFGHVFERAAHLLVPRLPPENRRSTLDLSEARLIGVDLTSLELAEANLSGTTLAEADLSGSCLWRAHGSQTDLRRASLRHANLEEVVLTGLKAENADFSFANLVAANFAPKGTGGIALLRNAQFVGARLQGARFDRADLRDARFDRANLRGASFHGAIFSDATLRTVLRSVNKSWQAPSCRWDKETQVRLAVLAKDRDTTKPSRRPPSDQPPPHYRSHPHPHQKVTPRRRPASIGRRSMAPDTTTGDIVV